MKQQPVWFRGRLIVTVFTGLACMRCSSDGVNLPRWGDGNPAVCRIRPQHLLPPAHTRTHTHFNTSSSIFCTPILSLPPPPPPQQDQIAWPPVAYHHPIHSLMCHYLSTTQQHSFAKVGINYRPYAWKNSKMTNMRLTHHQAFIDHYKVTIYLLFHPCTVWQFIDSDRIKLPNHRLSFIRLGETQESLFET